MVITPIPQPVEQIPPLQLERPFLLEQAEVEETEGAKRIIVAKGLESGQGLTIAHSWVEIKEVVEVKEDMVPDSYIYNPYEQIATYFSRQLAKRKLIDKQLPFWVQRTELAQFMSVKYARILFTQEYVGYKPLQPQRLYYKIFQKANYLYTNSSIG